MKRSLYRVGQTVFSIVFTEKNRGLINQVIYSDPSFQTYHYEVKWEDGTYSYESDWELSDTKILF